MGDNVVTLLRREHKFTHFHQRLLIIREIRGMSQSELAKRSSLKPSAISHFERGARLPSFENLRSLAMSLSCTADYLLGIDADPARRCGDPLMESVGALKQADREYLQLLVDAIVARNEQAEETE